MFIIFSQINIQLNIYLFYFNYIFFSILCTLSIKLIEIQLPLTKC